MKVLLYALGVVLVISTFAQNPPARHRLLFSRVGPLNTGLFVANGDGSGEHPLLPATGLDYSPSFSVDGRWVVFTSERDGSADLYRVHPDGTALERLTDDPAYDDQGSLAPDGGTLAFVSTRGGGRAHVWLLDLATKRTRLLTGSDNGGDFRPSWSPDGQWIVFSSDRDAHAGNLPGRWEHLQSTGLYAVRPDGTGLRRLTHTGGFAGTPRWSADGARVLCYETVEVGTWFAQRGDPDRGATQIVSVEVATGVTKQYSAGNGIRLWPQWLPDGRIGYLAKDSAAGAPGVGLTAASAADTAHLEWLAPDGTIVRGERGMIRNPSWSSDGRRLVFHRVVTMGQAHLMKPVFSRLHDFDLVWTDPFPAFSPQGDRLAYSATQDGVNVQDTAIDVMTADGSQRRRLFWRQGFSAFSPAWSPRGDLIAFSVGRYFRAPGHPSAQIALMSADGSNQRLLIDDDVNNGFPSWSPDGMRLVYKKDRHLAILSLDDGRSTDLTAPGPQYDNFPQWSPKGDRILFTSDRDGDFELYTISPGGADLRRLTRAPGNDSHGVWSPDAEFIVFSSARMGFKDERPLAERIPQPYGELFVMRADGTDLRQLTDNQWEDATPAWMPEAARAPSIAMRR